MIILDTNIISELMRATPEVKVLKWIEGQKATNLAITAIGVAEIQRGILRLPKGKKRKTLHDNFLAFVEEAFIGRVFPFDERAAYLYGEIASDREKTGFNTDAVDLMIAAIAKNYNAAIATRNTKDFNDCGVKLINPWE